MRTNGRPGPLDDEPTVSYRGLPPVGPHGHAVDLTVPVTGAGPDRDRTVPVTGADPDRTVRVTGAGPDPDPDRTVRVGGAGPARPRQQAAGPAGPGADGEIPGRHRRRAGASPDERPAAEYRTSGRNARSGRRRRPAFWRELPLLVVVALVLTFLIQTFLAKVYIIPSGSMETTLHGCSGCTNDRVLVDKVTYRFSDPQPGDVVVFRGPEGWSSEITIEKPDNPFVRGLQLFGSLVGLAPPDEKDFVKRVIAVGGQTVQCCDSRNRVMVDGQPLNEPYVYFLPAAGQARQEPFGPITVPAGQLFMMGDSRNNSADSRVPQQGPVPLDHVIGKARVIVLPFARFGGIDAINPQADAAGWGTAPQAPEALSAVGALGWLAHRRRRREDEFLPGT